jgi:hypothetical protein
MREKKAYEIISGPDFFQICESLKYSYEAAYTFKSSPAQNHTVKFEVKISKATGNKYFKVVIDRIETNLSACTCLWAWGRVKDTDHFPFEGKRIQIGYTPEKQTGSSTVVSR